MKFAGQMIFLAIVVFGTAALGLSIDAMIIPPLHSLLIANGVGKLVAYWASFALAFVFAGVFPVFTGSYVRVYILGI